MIVAMIGYAVLLGMPVADIIPLVLTAVLASIPEALPATFKLAAALGAQDLAKLGVLPTRLTAVDEAATMDVLCADKTGTLTQNTLAVTDVRPMPGFGVADVLSLAALASSDGGQDPVDAAIREAAKAQPATTTLKLIVFSPFDPAIKMSAATAARPDGVVRRVAKGAYAVVGALAQSSPQAEAAVEALQSQGFRVLAVAAGPKSALKLAGLIALSDPPRADSSALVAELRELGVRMVMVTGDAPATASSRRRWGSMATCRRLERSPTQRGWRSSRSSPACCRKTSSSWSRHSRKTATPSGCAVTAPNDAPALRQAQIGIAVSTATDVAKSAAGVVLTEPRLGGIAAAVREGRITFQRILTYVLNSITKKVVQVLLLAVGLVLTGHAILTPLLMVIIMITSDFLGMSLTTDNVRPSPRPNVWRIGSFTAASVAMGIYQLACVVAIFAVGAYRMKFDIDTLRTLTFVVIVFSNQATTYTNRSRKRLWATRPSVWLIVSSVADILIASTLAIGGIAMAPLAPVVVAATLGATVVFTFALDAVKVPIFSRLRIV